MDILHVEIHQKASKFFKELLNTIIKLINNS